MHIRQVNLYDDTQQADAGTFTLDLKTRDPITELVVRFKLVNTDAECHQHPVEQIVTKIEIVDGGREIWSGIGETSVGYGCLDVGKWPVSSYDEYNSRSQRMHFPLRFGRFLGDPDFGFDPTRLNNPQVRVTWVNHANHLADSVRLGVTAKVMEGVPAPPQCLTWTEIVTFNSADSGVKVIELPVDHPYRRMLIRAHGQSSNPTNILTHFKFDCDVGNLVLFDLDAPEFRDIIYTHFGPFEYRRIDVLDSGQGEEAWMGGNMKVHASPGAGNRILAVFGSGNTYFTVSVHDVEAAAVNDVVCEVGIWGYFPHNCLGYQFGVAHDPATWFPAPDYQDIDLKLTQAVADCEVTVAIQEPITL